MGVVVFCVLWYSQKKTHVERLNPKESNIIIYFYFREETNLVSATPLLGTHLDAKARERESE